MKNDNTVVGHTLQNKAKIDNILTRLSKIQIQLMDVGISNADYNDISEVIGDAKERLANAVVLKEGEKKS